MTLQTNKNSNTNHSIILFLKEIEHSLKKKDFNYFGVNYWPVIRLHLSFSLIEKNYQNLVNPKKNKIKTKKVAGVFQKDIPADFFITHKNYLINIDGINYDRVMEDLIVNSKNPLILDISDFSLYQKSTQNYVGSLRYKILFIKLLSVLISILGFIFFIRIRREIIQLKERSKLSKDIDFISTQKLITKIIYIQILSIFLKRFFRKLKIKKIYQSMYYDNFGLAAGLASQKSEILNSCVQHGGQSKNNPAFGSWNNMPVRGYDFLPNKFLCWDEFSTLGINEWANLTEKHSSEIIGYGWIDIWKHRIQPKDEVSVSKAVDKNHLRILVTLQPSVNLKQTYLFKVIKGNIKNIHWTIRAHPRQDNKDFLDLLNSDLIDVKNISIESSKIPLPLLLQTSDLHVTFFSSSVFEAKLLGVKTVIVDQRGIDYFEPLIEEGSVVFAENLKDLLKIIDRDNKIKNG